MMRVEVEEEEEVIGIGIASIRIWGPTLSSLLQRFTSSPHSTFQGLLFGHTTRPDPIPLFTDDTPSHHPIPPSVSTVTSFLTTPVTRYSPYPRGVIGCFSARRASPLRPSLSESSLVSALPTGLGVFLLVVSPVSEGGDADGRRVHTAEYRGYEFRRSRGSLVMVPKSVEVVNVGPSFRSHYHDFSSAFPLPAAKEVVNCMADQNEDDHEDDVVRRLDVLTGAQAKDYTTELEGLYRGMLDKLNKLAVLVDNTSFTVFQQENRNMKLRFKIAGLE